MIIWRDIMKVRRRRRRENKTDYKLRFGLLKSTKPRFVIRKTNKYIIIQLVETSEAQDKIKSGISSKELLKNGWDIKFKGSLKSIPAAYLTGILMARKVGKGDFIIDMGMVRNLSGSRIYAAAKGLIDGGLKIAVDESVFPSEEKILGKQLNKELQDMIKNLIAKIKNG